MMVFLSINKFKQYLVEEEYCPSTVRWYSDIVRKFASWAMARDSLCVLLCDVLINEYLDPDAVISGRPKDYKSVRAALHAYRTSLVKTGYAPAPYTSCDPIEQVLCDYVSHLRDTAGLSVATQLTHRQYLRRFLRMAWKENHTFEPSTILSVSTVQHYLTDELKHLRPASRKRVVGVIRGFARYLQLQGVAVDAGVLNLPLTTPVWKLSHIPKTLPSDDIQRILLSYDRSTDVGCRDYAIALCFIDLGLRTSEVAQLSLDDFRWHEGTVSIRKTKTHQERELPLPQRMGEAIVKYLTQSRPSTGERTLFVRFAHRSGTAMGCGQIRGTVRRAYARAGLPPTITSIHILRHTKAASLYEQGSSLKMIADVLGHTSIDTTVIYTKVGGSALYDVMCRWPIPDTDARREASK